MPVYEYECPSCHARFEQRQGYDTEPMALCPCCSGRARRVLHSVPVIFKGAGFYITDSRKGNHEEKSESLETVKAKKGD